MHDNVTPEEKLLNLIKKGKDNSKDKPEELKQEESVGKPLAAPKVSTSIPRKIKIKYVKSFSILNNFLIIAVVCNIIYMVFSYIYPYRPGTETLEKIDVKREDQKLGDTPRPLPPLSHYTGVVSTRQMFKLYEAPKPKPVGPPKPKVTLQQLLAGYTFVGVIFGDVPQAIVEEKRSGQSFYLTAGQYLGEIKVEKIERGRITVSYEDEMIDISI